MPLIIFVFIIFLAVFIYLQNNYLVITKININTDVHNSFKIVHLSDLHGKQFGNKNKNLLNSVLDTEPDLVVFTGDIIDKQGDNIEVTIDFISEMNNSVPVVCITGNHEPRTGLMDEIKRSFKEKEIPLLMNELLTITVKDNKINILGLNEIELSNKENKILFDELASMEGFNIVLSHYPENYALKGEFSYNKFDFNIMCSGHAHGGQFILPFIGGVYSPGQGINPEYYEGLHDGRLIVSRGLGGKFPLRLFNYPEIIEININNN